MPIKRKSQVIPTCNVDTPFQIGSATFQHRLIQAPLAGISCAPFRELFAQYETPAYAVTEMISAQSMLQHERLKPRYLSHSKQEGPWAIQLSGYEASFLSEAVRIAQSYQPDLIDLNCGCPKPKIRGKGCGSALMDSPKDLQQAVTAMRQATTLPLTVKIRTSGNTDDSKFLEAASIIEQCGADAIIVHGRHHTEGYDVAANYQQIRQVVERVTIPVIANGDVNDTLSMQRCFEETGAIAIMIARGSIGKPWLFKQLLKGIPTPMFAERLNVFSKHIEGLALIEGSDYAALLQARRLLKWYFPALNEEELADCYAIKSMVELIVRLKKTELVPT